MIIQNQKQGGAGGGSTTTANLAEPLQNNLKPKIITTSSVTTFPTVQEESAIYKVGSVQPTNDSYVAGGSNEATL